MGDRLDHGKAVRAFSRWLREHDLGIGLCFLHDTRRPCLEETDLEEFLSLYEASRPSDPQDADVRDEGDESAASARRTPVERSARVSGEPVEEIGSVGPLHLRRVGNSFVIELNVDAATGTQVQLATSEIAELHSLTERAMVSLGAPKTASQDDEGRA